MAISKRIFGSDIPDKVKHKLKIRQILAQTDPSVHESIQGVMDHPTHGKYIYLYHPHHLFFLQNLNSELPYE